MASKYSRKNGFVRDADGAKKKIAAAEAAVTAAKGGKPAKPVSGDADAKTIKAQATKELKAAEKLKAQAAEELEAAEALKAQAAEILKEAEKPAEDSPPATPDKK